MKSHSIDFVRELNNFIKALNLPKPIFKHHVSKRKFYSVIMMPMEKEGDLSAFGSREGFDTRREANEEAAFQAIRGLKEYHEIAYRDISHHELLAEREENMVALTSVKDMMDEKNMLVQENTELRDAYRTVESRYLVMQFMNKENSRMRAKILCLESEIHSLKQDK